MKFGICMNKFSLIKVTHQVRWYSRSLVCFECGHSDTDELTKSAKLMITFDSRAWWVKNLSSYFVTLTNWPVTFRMYFLCDACK